MRGNNKQNYHDNNVTIPVTINVTINVTIRSFATASHLGIASRLTKLSRESTFLVKMVINYNRYLNSTGWKRREKRWCASRFLRLCRRPRACVSRKLTTTCLIFFGTSLLTSIFSFERGRERERKGEEERGRKRAMDGKKRV